MNINAAGWDVLLPGKMIRSQIEIHDTICGRQICDPEWLQWFTAERRTRSAVGRTLTYIP